MKIVKPIIKKEYGYKFLIPFEGRCFDIANRGDRIKKGDLLFIKEYKKIIESYNLVKELGIKPNQAKDYVARIDGEYVVKGDILAEKIVGGGLSIKKVLATKEGIVSFERIEKGYIDILSEHQKEEIYADFKGEVVGVDINKGIEVVTDAISVIFSLSNIENCTGRVEVLGDGSSIYTVKDLDSDYFGKIVYVGRYAYGNLINEVIARGALCVITHAMEYEDFSSINAPIVVVGGFGNISYDNEIDKVIKAIKGELATVENGRIVFPDNGQYLVRGSKEVIRPSLKVNDFVHVLDPENIGKYGKIIDNSSEDGYCTVILNNGDRIMALSDYLDAISI